MENINLAEAVNKADMYELSYKTNHKMELDETSKEVIASLDESFKEIGKSGHDPKHEISAFVTKVINRELYETPDELLDALFDRSVIGVDDDFDLMVEPKNTLVAYDAAPGGNVPRSFLDITSAKPTWANKQIETDISFQDLERDGWKTVARLTEYATQELKNRMFLDVFTAIDNGITSGAPNYIAAGAAMPTQTVMDQVSLYISDRVGTDGVIVALSKYIQAASKLTGFVSADMINEVYRNGFLGMYDGIGMTPISAAKKTGNGATMFIDKRIFGIAGKIGALSQKGEVKIYQEENINKECVHLKFANFTFGYAFSDSALENIVKVVLQ